MTPDLRTVIIARGIAEEETEVAYDALSEEILELRAEVAELRRRLAEEAGFNVANYRGILKELERLREALG